MEVNDGASSEACADKKLSNVTTTLQKVELSNTVSPVADIPNTVGLEFMDREVEKAEAIRKLEKKMIMSKRASDSLKLQINQKAKQLTRAKEKQEEYGKLLNKFSIGVLQTDKVDKL